MGLASIVNTSIPKVAKKSRKEWTVCNFFFATNLVCKEAMAGEDLNPYCKVMRYLEDQIDELEEQTILGTQGGAAYSSNMRITQAAAVWDIIRSSVL